MLIEMEITALAIDPATNMPIVILKNDDGSELLPIWIGLLEASAIATKLENIEPPRPMTHDLMRNVLDALSAQVKRITITDLEDNTYFARVHVMRGDEELVFDARPSDSMALALRFGAKIFVEDTVLEKTRESVERKMPTNLSGDKEKWIEILENMDPEDFGKYKM
ncbi:bifunctional nuclease family protein [bacterium]|nr:bifunctional nuclease family protein [bacterium]